MRCSALPCCQVLNRQCQYSASTSLTCHIAQCCNTTNVKISVALILALHDNLSPTRREHPASPCNSYTLDNVDSLLNHCRACHTASLLSRIPPHLFLNNACSGLGSLYTVVHIALQSRTKAYQYRRRSHIHTPPCHHRRWHRYQGSSQSASRLTSVPPWPTSAPIALSTLAPPLTSIFCKPIME